MHVYKHQEDMLIRTRGADDKPYEKTANRRFNHELTSTYRDESQ